MDATDLVEAIREAANTELSRLGSSKSLYADTEGEMEPDAVLSAMADAAHHAAEAADGWTNDGGSADVYASVAATEREHYDAIAGELDGHEPGDRPDALAVLRDLEGPQARLGGLLGWTLVAGEKAAQATGFFTGQADPTTASLFRGFGEDYDARRGELVDALDEAAVDEDATDRARAAAVRVIGAAYDDYVGTLEDLGVNPKPVC